MTDTEMLQSIFDKLVIIENDMKSLKTTAMKVEHELIPNVQILLENHVNIAKKVDLSNDLQEEYKQLRFEIDLIKQQLKTFTA